MEGKEQKNTSQPEKERASFTKWQYLVFNTGSKRFLSDSREENPLPLEYNTRLKDIQGKSSDTSVITALNLLGEDGWELVLERNHEIGGTFSSTKANVLIFKRPKRTK